MSGIRRAFQNANGTPLNVASKRTVRCLSAKGDAVMTEYRPHPNVVQHGRRYTAVLPSHNGKRVYLGSVTTPEDAAVAVLTAQAENLESKARGYRDRAAALRRRSR